VLVSWTDILDGEIVNTAWAVAQMAAKPRATRQTRADLDTAAWGDTDRLSADVLTDITASSEMPDLTEGEVAILESALQRHEVQGALQALLTARLTDAPEQDASQAREAVRLAISQALLVGRQSPPATVQQQSRPAVPELFDRKQSEHVGGLLSEYFDEKISGLVASLEGRVGFAGLAQVRAEAYSARIVAVLGAIERQVAALTDPDRQLRDEEWYLQRYRGQAHQRHGFLTPPDFDRRRRIPVADIYVPSGIDEKDHSERGRLTLAIESGMNVWNLVGKLGRTVLLGDPGGGKTTAVNVLADYFASDATCRIPLVVTLREYAARTPIDWSVAEHIEHNLNALYQCPAPDGLVERLLLTGRAVVIFDGLDELLDTSRRRDVSDRVEQFCSAYPLTPVLVTSRVVGYDQARLDDAQFTCYRLGGFGDDQVAEYARKWFRTQENMPETEAEVKAAAFLTESSNTKDLRANPLLLSLMCILYRGSGSLPGDRVGIYSRCAELLLRKWDEQRDLYEKFGADHLVEPTLRYLAWWLYTREDSQATASEREMLAKTSEFLYGRAYDTEDEARLAAREFVDFCRGRMWVFSDAGTTASGEKLYGFTHRTFLEYFAAWHLAVTTESPEDLAQSLASRITSEGWQLIGELAIKIKSDTIDRGSDRIYMAMLNAMQIPEERGAFSAFLAKCLKSVRPSPATVRKLIDLILDETIEFPKQGKTIDKALEDAVNYEQVVAEEINKRIASMGESGDAQIRRDGLDLLGALAWHESSDFWDIWATDQLSRYAADVIGEAAHSTLLRSVALQYKLITIDQALAMPGGFDTLTQGGENKFFAWSSSAYVSVLCYDLKSDIEDTSTFAGIGRYLSTHQKLPWGRPENTVDGMPEWDHIPDNLNLDQLSGLGMAACLASYTEIGDNPRIYLTSLPMPAEFKKLFRDWEAGRVNFLEFKQNPKQDPPVND
jgi:hypothetical protein